MPQVSHRIFIALQTYLQIIILSITICILFFMESCTTFVSGIDLNAKALIKFPD